MTTVSQHLFDIERSHLTAASRPVYDTAAAGWNTSTTSWQLSTVDTVPVGSILNSGFELAYVTGWNDATQTATVIRGFLGSTPATAAAGALVRVDPRYSDVNMLGALIAEIRSWDDRVFRVSHAATTFGANDTSIAVTFTLAPYRVLDARVQPRSTYDVRGKTYPVVRVEPVGQFASGYSLSVGAPFGESTVVDVYYAVPFTTATITGATDLQTDIGLTDDLVEVVTWGVMWRLMAGREVGRGDATVLARPDIDQAVPIGGPVRVAQEFRKMRDTAYNEAAKRLLARWPYRYAA